MQIIAPFWRRLGPHERTVSVLSIVVFCVAAIILGVVWFYKNSDSIPARGGSLTLGLVGQPASINPILAASETDRALVSVLFSPLSVMSEKVEPEEGQEGRSWRVRLADGWQWSDKEKITSDDIIFTLDKIREAGPLSPNFSTWKAVRAQRVSEREVIFLLPAPYALFPTMLETLYPTPKHIFKELPVANWRISEYMLQPVGNGPFKSVSTVKKKDGFVLEMSTESALGSPTRPFISTIKFSFFPNSEEELAAFNSGVIGGFFTLETPATGKIMRPFELKTRDTRGLYGIYLNPSKNEVLSDVRVRHALSAILDRNAIAKAALGEDATPMFSTLPLQTSGTASSSTEDFAALLTAGGWNKNDSGWSKTVTRAPTRGSKKGATPPKQDIKVLTLSLISPDVPFLKRAGAEAVKEWQAAGIQVAATEASVDTLSSEEVKNRTFEAMLWGQVFDATFDLYPFWHSSQRFAPGLNLTLLSDPLLDSSLETYRENMDANKRDSALLQAEDRANQSFLFIPLFSPRLTLVHTSDLRGLPEGAANEPADFLTSAANWYVHTTRKLK